MLAGGYAGESLRVDLSTGNISRFPTMQYADRFLGGRGLAAKIYWDEVPPEVGPFDPENRLMFFTGPMGGIPGIGGSRFVVCGKSALTRPHHFNYCSLGGNWSTQIKAAGFDGVVVQGKADRPVYLLIEGGKAELKDARALWGRSALEVREDLSSQYGKSSSSVVVGPAGEHMVHFATLLSDKDASGSGGLGAVMGSKGLKAIVARGTRSISVANPERFREVRAYIRQLKRHPEQVFTTMKTVTHGLSKRDTCYGCLGACPRATYTAKDGTRGKFVCSSALFYQDAAMRHYGEWNDVPFHANKLGDAYGIDLSKLKTLLVWMTKCREAGILNDENTGLRFDDFGSFEFVETLIRKISFREGFGDILANGVFRAAESVGYGASELITDFAARDGHGWNYCPRMSISTAILYAMEPRHPVQMLHEIGRLLYTWVDWVNGQHYLSTALFRQIAARFFGGELAADLSTYDGKALAAAMIQDREYAKESLILCDWMWPITHVPSSEDHVGDPTVESKLLSAVTGTEVGEKELYRIGERIMNLQRAVLVREGHGGRLADTLPEAVYSMPLMNDWNNPDCLAPGKDGEIISKKGAVVDRERFEQMKDEYYALRGWDVATGLQTKSRLIELDLNEVGEDLAERKLLR